MPKMKITALPCLCADIFDGTDIIRPGGEALNFAVHASRFENAEVTLLGVVGDDAYGKAILESIEGRNINTKLIRIDGSLPTAHNITYLTPEGDRYYKADSWQGRILENIVLQPKEKEVLEGSDAVFIHFTASCFEEVLELKKKRLNGKMADATGEMLLAVDFDVCRDFELMEKYAPYIDFFMISGEEKYLPYFKAYSEKYPGIFNMSLGEKGSVTYQNGREYRVFAVPVKEIKDTTGCGDSYHAGLVCSYLSDEERDVEKAMRRGSEIAAETLGKMGGF